MEFLFFWLAFALIVGVAASGRGRSGVGWFLFSLVISPVVAGLLLLAFGRPATNQPVRMDEAGQMITGETHVRCPDCRELVRKDARKCKHCGTALVPQ